MISNVWLISMLVWLALEDADNCRLKNRTLLGYSVFGIIAAAVRFGVYGATTGLVDCITLGSLLFVMQKLTKEQIGTGDIWVLAGLPLYIEETVMWESMWSSLLLMAAAAMIVYIQERNKKTGIPYIPFLCAGVIISTWRSL